MIINKEKENKTMKKIFAIMATAIVALGFASCSNDIEEAVVEKAKQPIKININVADLSADAQTRAAKTGWVTGDKINIWFNGSTSANPEAVIVYDGSAWALEGTISNDVLTRMAANSGNQPMSFFYESRNDLSQYTNAGYSSTYKEVTYNFSGTAYKNAPLICYGIASNSWRLSGTQNKFNYDAGTNTLTMNMSIWEIETKLQVVVAGLTPADAANYYLVIEDPSGNNRTLGTNNGVVVKMGAFYGFSGISGSLISSLGMPNADGVAFYYSLRNGDYNGDLTFKLYSTADNTQQGNDYAVTGKTLNSAVSAFNNIKINKAKFGL